MLKQMIAVMCLFGSQLNAKSTEELLPDCIESAESIIVFAEVFKAAEDRMGEGISSTFASEMYIASEYAAQLNSLSSDLSKGVIEGDTFAKEYHQTRLTMRSKYDLVIKMIDEAFDAKRDRSAFAAYVAACTEGFNEKTITQAEKIKNLQEIIVGLNAELVKYESAGLPEITDLELKVKELEGLIKAQATEQDAERLNLQLEIKKSAVIKNALKDIIKQSLVEKSSVPLLSYLDLVARTERTQIIETHFGPLIDENGVLNSCVNWLKRHGDVTRSCQSVFKDELTQRQ